MKKVFSLLIAIGICFQLLSLPVYGGTKDRITWNQLMGKDYMLKLKNGADPDKLERPRLTRHHKWKVKQSRREVIKAMDAAEALARAGKRELIEENPEYSFKGMSEEDFTALREKKNKQK